jgi:hypothetical protein
VALLVEQVGGRKPIAHTLCPPNDEHVKPVGQVVLEPLDEPLELDPLLDPLLDELLVPLPLLELLLVFPPEELEPPPLELLPDEDSASSLPPPPLELLPKPVPPPPLLLLEQPTKSERPATTITDLSIVTLRGAGVCPNDLDRATSLLNPGLNPRAPGRITSAP